MSTEQLNTIFLGFLSIGQLATFLVVLRLGVQYGRDSTTLNTVERDVAELKPVVASHTAQLGQHEWRLGSHDARHNTTEAAIEHLRLKEDR